jgi:hypothetical protein
MDGRQPIDEAALVEALSAIVRAEARPGLRSRVMARLGEHEPSTSPLSRWRPALTAVFLALLLVATWLLLPGERQRLPGAAAAPALATAAPLPVPHPPADVELAAITRRAVRVTRPPAAVTWHAALPPLAPPEPLGIDPLDTHGIETDRLSIEPVEIESLSVDSLE